MPTISKGRAPLTLINVFTVRPEKQEELIVLLKEITERDVRHHKGFISASLHRGLDGGKVAMYAQWASIDDYESMRKNSGSASSLKKPWSSQSLIRECMRSRRYLSPIKMHNHPPG
jgi:quinol monooxygenase YgiN